MSLMSWGWMNWEVSGDVVSEIISSIRHVGTLNSEIPRSPPLPPNTQLVSPLCICSHYKLNSVLHCPMW